MVDLGTLIAAAKTISGLRAFVFEGGMAELVSDIELAAAHDAFSKSSLARDPKSEIRAAIGHLESALYATLKSAESAQKQIAHILVFGPMQYGYVEALKERAKYISCLMAAAYLILGDSKLCKRQILMLDDIEKAAPGSPFWYITGAITSIIPPPFILFLDLPKTNRVKPRIDREEQEELVKRLNELADKERDS
jgi:hypothetical protein